MLVPGKDCSVRSDAQASNPGPKVHTPGQTQPNMLEQCLECISD